MKIGILTQPLLENYGGLLQNYALQQVLIEKGYEVKTLDWYYDFRTTRERRVSFIKTKILSLFNHLYKDLHFLTLSEIQELSSQVMTFKKNINLTRQIDKPTLLKSIAEEENFAVYIVGSDQCWRPKYNGLFLSAMFLDFVKDNKEIKKIAYAASFGTDKWEYSLQETKEFSFLAKNFDLISVREQSGVMLCRDYLGVKAHLVLDPTLLLDKEHYKRLFLKGSCCENNMLVTYILDKTSEIESELKNVEKRIGLVRKELIPASYNYKDGRDLEKYKRMSVNEWLWHIYNSKITIVDSFHGMVFSILFNKPFWVLGNKSRGLSRFCSLLDILGLKSRLITVEELKEVDLKEKIDWEKVNSELQRKRRQSLDLLFESIENV